MSARASQQPGQITHAEPRQCPSAPVEVAVFVFRLSHGQFLQLFVYETVGCCVASRCLFGEEGEGGGGLLKIPTSLDLCRVQGDARQNHG